MIADRVNKRRLLLVTQTAHDDCWRFCLRRWRGSNAISVWGVAAIAFLNGVAMAMNAPSYQALVPRLVKREDLTNAIALNSAQFNMSRILGPTLGGYAMVIFGVAGNFFLNGIELSGSDVGAGADRVSRRENQPSPGHIQKLAQRVCLSAEQPADVRLIWMTAVASFFGIPFMTFIPYFAKMQLNAGESGLGWLLAGSGLGSCAGRDDGGGLRRDTSSGKGAEPAAAWFSLPRLSASATRRALRFRSAWRSLEGYTGILMISCFNVSIQHLSSDEMRGRVMSIYATSFLGLPPIGALLAGRAVTPYSLRDMRLR